MIATKEFQIEVNYDNFHKKQSRCCRASCGTNGGGEQRMATQYVTHSFGFLALVLEMPFIDHNNQANSVTGWSVPRSINLWADMLNPIYNFL